MDNKLAITIFAVLFLLTACGTKATPPAPPPALSTVDTIVAEGHVIPAQALHLVCPTRGRVEEVLVNLGDIVRQGQVLVRLGDHEQADAALTAATLELTSAQQAYDTLIRTADLGRARAWQNYLDAQKARAAAQLAWDKLDLASIQAEIDDGQADVTSKQTELENAQADFDKYEDLPKDNATRKTYENALRTAQTNYDLAVQKMEASIYKRDSVRAALDSALAAELEARLSYDKSADGADRDALALAQARLDNATAQAVAAQSAVDSYTLKAPFDGSVAGINLDPGQYTGPETWAVALVDTSQWFVETSDLSELDVVNVAIGQQVVVTADALPGVTMTGTVEEISTAPVVAGGDILYTVRISLTDPDPKLLWGMTMELTFTPGE